MPLKSTLGSSWVLILQTLMKLNPFSFFPSPLLFGDSPETLTYISLRFSGSASLKHRNREGLKKRRRTPLLCGNRAPLQQLSKAPVQHQSTGAASKHRCSSKASVLLFDPPRSSRVEGLIEIQWKNSSMTKFLRFKKKESGKNEGKWAKTGRKYASR